MTSANQGAKQVAKQGDTVKVHYTGKLLNGDIFDSSQSREPLSFTLGSGQVIAGFDQAVDGLAVGEKTQTTIAPEDAYGHSSPERIIQIERSNIPEDIVLEKGLELMMQTQSGQPVPVKVTDFDEHNVTLDANHALAGETLIFDLELVEIV